MANYSRKNFIKLLGAGSLAAFPVGSPTAFSLFNSEEEEAIFYVGTYTDGSSEGIYRCSFSPGNGAITKKGVTEGIENPSFIAFEPDHQFLYAVGETSEYNGFAGGSVNAYRISGDNALELINARPSHGAYPCHIYVDKSSRYVMTANYMSGNVAVYPIMENGGLGYASDINQHYGSGPNPDRQKGPHAHCIITDAANRYAFSCDLGTDKVMINRFNTEYGTLLSGFEPFVKLEPGSGPRHIKFHPNGKVAYVINEMGSSVSVLDYNSAKGVMKVIQTISTLPADFDGQNSCAELQISSDGKFLYGSNRGHDSIVVYSIDSASGRLSAIQHQSTMGRTPRHFNLDPTGNYLLAANQDTGNIVVFRRDRNSGKISATGNEISISKPVCIKFL